MLLGSIFVVPEAKKYDADTDKYVPHFQMSLLLAFDYREIDSTFLQNEFVFLSWTQRALIF
jgi:hypothetical protein